MDIVWYIKYYVYYDLKKYIIIIKHYKGNALPSSLFRVEMLKMAFEYNDALHTLFVPTLFPNVYPTFAMNILFVNNTLII